MIGPAATASEALCTLAEEVGRLLASAGAVLVTGGGAGVMASAAAGATAAGGVTVGILPGSDRRSAVGDLTVAIPTGLGELRNGLVVRSADAVIAIGGSWGTASEIALALRTRVPLVALSGWRYLDGNGLEIEVTRAGTPAEAVAKALALAGT